VDGLWNLIEANPAASLLWDGVDPALLEPPVNMLLLAVHPDGLPRISSMTRPATPRSSISSGARAATTPTRRSPSWSTSSSRISRPSRRREQCTSPVSLDLRTRVGDVSLFTLIATLGAPLEVTAANLAIETFLPIDAESAARLQELADSAERATSVPD
jgi:hypothetical protein